LFDDGCLLASSRLLKILSGESFRVAVVGMGKMGLLHASILNVLPNVQLTALCDKSGILRKFLKSMFKQIHVVNDLEKLYDLNLDAVYVTTPIPAHFSVVKSIYSKKIARNLFVEKTLASNYDKAKELCELANSSGGINMVGYMRRFSVTFMKAKSLLDQEVIGELVSFGAYAYSSDFSGINRGSKASAARGGVLRDLGSHVMDVALWYFGDLQIESAKLVSLVENRSEDSAYFSVRNSNGLEGKFDVSWCAENYRMPEVCFSIVGSNGIITVNDDKLELRLKTGKKSTWYRQSLDDTVFFWLGGPEYFRENEYFVESAIEGKDAEPSFYTASKIDRMIEQIQHRADESEQ
jgi:predicted dehydrogenase